MTSSQPKFKDVRIQNEGNVTRVDILNEANALYQKCLEISKKAGVDTQKIISAHGKQKKEDLDFLDNLFKAMRSEHKQLFDTYPTVVRHMIQELQYSKSAFDEYLKGVEKKPWSNDKERMDSYAHYGLLLYKKVNKGQHLSKTQLELFRTDYRKRLQDEHDEFMDKIEEHKKQIEKEEAKYTDSLKKDLISLFKKELSQEDEKKRAKMDGRDPVEIGGAADTNGSVTREQLENLVKAGILSSDVLDGV